MLAGLICYAIIRSLFAAAARPFWYDEVCTWAIVRQPNISAVWRALAHGVDGQPPFYYVIVRFFTHLVHNEQFSFRIPSIAGFACTIFCLFVFIRKRTGTVNALLWAAIPFFTVLFDTYAVEGRPYSLVVACVAIALVCYQHAPATGWIILLGCSLACAQALHYYSVISFVPFFASEGTLLLRSRRLRLGVWLALAFAFLPLACFWTLLARFRAFYGTHFWSLPTLRAAELSYGWFFNVKFIWGAILATVTALAMLGTMLLAERRAAGGKHLSEDLIHEHVLVLGLLSLPFVAFVVAEIAHGGFTSRYALSALLGFPLAATYVVPRIKGRTIGIIAILALVLALTLQEHKFWSSYKTPLVPPAVSVENFLASAGHPDLPVVVSDAIQFLPLTYYATPEWRKRFVMIVDPSQSVLYAGSDSTDKEMQVMRDYAPIQVYDFQAFVADHATFLLYSSNAGQGDDWWVARLFRDGYKLKLVAMQDYYHRVFLVSRGGAGH